MFFGSFAWSFVFVSLPFHIQRVSTLEPAATLRWTGWIVGITSLVTVMTAPVWGRYAARGNPKACYVAVEALQGLGFFVMALARTLPELFFARLVLGAMGAASTLAFIMVGRSVEGAEVRRRIATLQSAMTVAVSRTTMKVRGIKSLFQSSRSRHARSRTENTSHLSRTRATSDRNSGCHLGG